MPFASGAPQNPSVFADKIVGEGVAASCEAWNVAASPSWVAQPVQSDLPVLLISGRFDPITPPEHAEIAARSLPNAVHVVRDGRSHGVWFADDCVAGIVEDFVADPDGPIATACADDAQPLDWSLPG